MEKAPDELRIEAVTLRQRGDGASALLADVRQDPALLIDDPQRDLRKFRITHTRPLGIKRGQGQGSLATSVLDTVDEFYASVLQQLKPWAARPPRLRQAEDDALEAATASDQLRSTSLSPQDGPSRHHLLSRVSKWNLSSQPLTREYPGALAQGRSRCPQRLACSAESSLLSG